MRSLVPIKVKIGLNEKGQHDYPDFNIMQCVKDSKMDWSVYIDRKGLSWHYDKCCGHNVKTTESPLGEQFGALIIPKEFADEAIATFPNEVTKLTELELEDFYDNHAHTHEPDELIDNNVLIGIELKQRLGLSLTPSQLKALDPEDKALGIRNNNRRKWTGLKKATDTKII